MIHLFLTTQPYKDFIILKFEREGKKIELDKV